MDERIRRLKKAIDDGDKYFLVIIDKKSTYTTSSSDDSKTLVRLMAAVGRTCERWLRRH